MTLRHIGLLWAVLLTASTAAVGAAPPPAAEGKPPFDVHIDESAAKLLPAIKAGEALLADAEIRVRCEYRYSGRMQWEQLVAASTLIVRQIRQGDLFWMERDNRAKELGGKATHHTEQVGYDGHLTRVWNTSEPDSSFGNLHLDRMEPTTLIYPHRMIGFCGSLSMRQSLETGVAGLKGVPPGITIAETIRRLADSEWLGRKCLVLEQRTEWVGAKDASGPQRFVNRLWICPEANYLPLKTEHFDLEGDREVLVEDLQVEELKEIEPGVFWPWRVTQHGTDKPAQLGGKPTPATSWEWTFESVKLRPKYPKERFAEIAFKEGRLVYVVQAGKITGNFVAGPNFASQELDEMFALDPAPRAAGKAGAEPKKPQTVPAAPAPVAATPAPVPAAPTVSLQSTATQPALPVPEAVTAAPAAPRPPEGEWPVHIGRGVALACAGLALAALAIVLYRRRRTF
jgi:hypothetical protein